MAYATTDPRSTLAAAAAPAATGANVAPQYFEFLTMPPAETSPAGGRTWWVRSQSVVLAFSLARAGDAFERSDQPDEYVALVDDPTASVVVETPHEKVAAQGRSLVVVPSGESSLTAHTDTALVRLFTTQSAELCRRCSNDAFYTDPDPNVAEYQPWPEPPAGERVRAYAIDTVPTEPARFGRIFRCRTLMVNWLYDAPGPRDPAQLSPHHHDDFEQLSLQLEGDYVHHIRTPWTIDMGQWRDDEHQPCASPALTVIPPPSIHTSQAVGRGSHRLIDIFSPPRHDFSARPGWVLNADEYPAPA